jgi:hypothetical protein
MATEHNLQAEDTQLLRTLYARAIAILASMDAAPTRSEAERLLTRALLTTYADGVHWGLAAMEQQLAASFANLGGTPS